MKKKLVIVGVCSLLCIGLMLTLYATSSISKKIYRASFIRKISRDKIEKIAELDLKFNSYYIAGVSKSRIYFANYTSPFYLLSTNHALLDSQQVQLNIKLDSIMAPDAFRLKVDSPYFFLTHGRMPEFLRGRIGQWTAERYLGTRPDYFAEALPISGSSIVIRCIVKKPSEYELAKKTTKTDLHFNEELLHKQVDGLFCLEGNLHQDKSNGNIVYMHTYRNEIIVADSNLNLLHRTHTIDTFSKALVDVFQKNGETTLEKPPPTINKNAAVYDNILFVQSNLLSKKEDMEEYLTNVVIDVYDIAANLYLTSFYIPDDENHGISSFEVIGSHFIAIIDNRAFVYDLPKGISTRE